MLVSVACLRRLSQSLVSVACLSRLSQTLVSVACLSRLSQSLVSVACLRRLSQSLVSDACLSRLSQMLVSVACLRCSSQTVVSEAHLRQMVWQSLSLSLTVLHKLYIFYVAYFPNNSKFITGKYNKSFMSLCVIIPLKECVTCVTLKYLKFVQHLFLHHKLWQSFNSVLWIFCAFVFRL